LTCDATIRTTIATITADHLSSLRLCELRPYGAIIIIITLRAKHSGVVYCNRSCLWRAVSVTTITRNCVHRFSLIMVYRWR